MSKFPKGLAHDFPQKFENSSQSHFLWKIPTHDFNNVLNERKKGFQTTKMSFRNAGKMCGVKPWFSSNFQSSYESHLVRKRSRHMFYNALNMKRARHDV